MRQILRRVAALEAGAPQTFEDGAPGAWIVGEPRQSVDEAIAAYEAVHGPVADSQQTVVWTIIESPGPEQ